MALFSKSATAPALIAAFLSVSLLLTDARTVLAEPHHQAAVLRDMPAGYRTFRHGHEHFYYHRGHFYRHERRGFVVTRPPAGLVIDALPALFTLVTVMGIDYYLSEGVYYRRVPAGYEVVPTPAPPPLPAAPVVQTPPAAVGSTVVVETALLNVRTGPSRNFPVVSQIGQGTNLAVQGTAPGWYYVQLPGGQSGWVMCRFTQPLAAG
jgi:uncharacterized protein YgiM (DUF1202 family)